MIDWNIEYSFLNKNSYISDLMSNYDGGGVKYRNFPQVYKSLLAKALYIFIAAYRQNFIEHGPTSQLSNQPKEWLQLLSKDFP
jgi:hypothetical protein